MLDHKRSALARMSFQWESCISLVRILETAVLENERRVEKTPAGVNRGSRRTGEVVVHSIANTGTETSLIGSIRTSLG